MGRGKRERHARSVGLRDTTTMYKIDNQKDILHNTKNYSQYLIITFNGAQTIKYRITMLYTGSISQFSSIAQSCPTLCNPTPGLPVHHQLLEFTQTNVHRVGDAIQPSLLCHPLLLPSIPPSIRVFSDE